MNCSSEGLTLAARSQQRWATAVVTYPTGIQEPTCEDCAWYLVNLRHQDTRSPYWAPTSITTRGRRRRWTPSRRRHRHWPGVARYCAARAGQMRANAAHGQPAPLQTLAWDALRKILQPHKPGRGRSHETGLIGR